jgi:hypothetical protein
VVAGGAAGGRLGALAGSGTSKENAELYMEAVRRGGSVVTARVPDEDEPRYAAILDRSAVNITQRAGLWRKNGWQGYDPAAPAYTADEIRRDRSAYL